MLIGTINIRPYGKGVRICTGETFTKYSGLSRDGLRGACTTEPEDDGFYVLGVFDNRIPTLIHELTHLASFTLIQAGILPSDSLGEPLAYLVEDLFQESVRLFKRKGITLELL